MTLFLNARYSSARTFSLAASALIFTTSIFAQEQARSADAFVDSVGINGFSPDDDASVFDRVHSLGIRHVRASLEDMDAKHAAIIAQAYSQYGIQCNFLVGQKHDVAANMNWLHFITPAAVDSVEGPNEVDGAPYGIGVSATLAYQSALFSAVKNDPVYAFAPVLNFTINNPNPITSDANDYANVHWYGWFDENNPFLPPAESPYGLNQYGSLAFDDAKAEQSITHPPKPIMFTEAGYSTVNSISRLGQAKYEPMMLVSNFTRNVARTYVFILQNDPSGQGLDIYGQPAGNAIRNLLSVLAEPGAHFTPGSLNYTIHTDGANVQHTLLQKSNSDFYLLLWNEVAVYDKRVTPPDLNNAPVTTTLDFAQPIRSAAVYTQNADGSYTTTTPALSGTSLTLAVPDTVTVVRLSPNEALPTSNATYTLVNQAANLCLDDPRAGTAPGIGVQVWTCNNTAAQNWTLHAAGNGWFTVNNQQSGLCLDDQSWGTASGTNAEQWTCNGQAVQNWKLEANADGAYTLVNQNSNLALDDQYALTQPGNKVWQYTINGTLAQHWQLRPR